MSGYAPWIMVGDGPYFVHYGDHPLSLDARGWVCQFVDDEKDARLIAAAPDLLEALRILAEFPLDEFDAYQAKADDRCIFVANDWRVMVRHIRAARDAITKATGETP